MRLRVLPKMFGTFDRSVLPKMFWDDRLGVLPKMYGTFDRSESASQMFWDVRSTESAFGMFDPVWDA